MIVNILTDLRYTCNPTPSEEQYLFSFSSQFQFRTNIFSLQLVGWYSVELIKKGEQDLGNEQLESSFE